MTNHDTTTTDTTTDTTSGLASRVLATPIGELTIVASSAGVRAVLWPVPGEAHRTRLGSFDTPPTTEQAEVLAAAADQLSEYFGGERTEFDLPLDPVGTDFQLAAWTALRTIPHGETVSYGEQADRLGDRNKARAVGAANGRNPISIVVPCHRVVGSDGSLTGFAAGADTKQWLLDHEARVAGHRLV